MIQNVEYCYHVDVGTNGYFLLHTILSLQIRVVARELEQSQESSEALFGSNLR
jgi:hypothetical protein